ncbi:MAG: hypothetical protein JW938_01940, partial [Candidatus Omnitrophica bacterium]|nr:hypothetical protein [Candidatus Omnitrophota bacterium]
YSANELYPMFDRLPDALLRFLLHCVNMIPASDRKVGFDYKAKRFFEGVLLHDIAKAHAYWRVIVPPHERTKLLKNVMQEDAYAVYYDLLYDKGRSAESRALADLTTWLPNNNLMRADIFSMCNSLEVRVPLLDLPLVQYMLRIPFAIRFKNGRKKYLLKKVLEDKLERRLIHRKKAGWHMPLAPWLKKGLYTYCADTFSSHHALFDTILKRDHCLSLLNEHKRGMQNNSFKLWGILVLLKHTA